jgi:hypothetical protein
MPIYSAVQRALTFSKAPRPATDASKGGGGSDSALRVRRALVGGGADGSTTHSVVGIQLDEAAKNALLSELRARANAALASKLPVADAGALAWQQLIARQMPGVRLDSQPQLMGHPLLLRQQQLQQQQQARLAQLAAQQQQLRAAPELNEFSQRDDDDDDDDEYGDQQQQYQQQEQQYQQPQGQPQGQQGQGQGQPPGGYRGEALAEMAELKRMLSGGSQQQLRQPLSAGSFGAQQLAQIPPFGCDPSTPLGGGWTPAGGQLPAQPQFVAPPYNAAQYASRAMPQMMQQAAAGQMAAPAAGGSAGGSMPAASADDDDLFDLVG